MKKGSMKVSAVTAALLCSMTTFAIAGGDIVPMEPEVKAAPVKADAPKRKLKGNMTLVYNTLPGSADSISEMFSDGIFYGRLRSNTFYWDWDKESWNGSKGRLDNRNMGVGGSLIFKSAAYENFSFTLGYYGSINPTFFRMDKDEVGGSKAGKDTFSRFKVKQTGHYNMHALGQGFLEYNNGTIDVRAGRQLFESVFTKSNDTKMIPNTFDGVTAAFKVAPKTTARVAWFGRQKLRDHEDGHDVITFQDANGESWNNNDDAGVHKGLTYANFKAAGEDVDHNLYVADVRTKYFKNLDFTLSGLTVPGVVKDIVAEAHYKIPFENGWALRPGIRYFYQMDDGGGAIGGANLKANETGYAADAVGSLDSSLLAARLDLKMPNKKGFFRLGYSKVADKADIVAPWRGFPTGGFTRAMGQYNWYANTKTYLVRAAYKFNKYFNTSVRYAVQDFDDAKAGVQADSNIWHIDNVSKFSKNFEMKVRVGLISADPGSSGKADVSYNEYRLEFNYLF